MKCNAYHIFFGNLSNPLKIKIVEALKEKSLSLFALMDKV